MGRAIAVRSDYTSGRGSAACEAGEGRLASAKASCDRGRSRRRLARGSCEGRRHGPSDAAGLGDPVQGGGPGGSHQQAVPWGAWQALTDQHKAFLARIVDEGPIPAIHGVVRWRACDLIMRLHEEFGLSVSDDTVYRALEELGYSHVSARPRAYKQDAEAMDAFKKTLPPAWRKSARSSHQARR
jgi:transposase